MGLARHVKADVTAHFSLRKTHWYGREWAGWGAGGADPLIGLWSAIGLLGAAHSIGKRGSLGQREREGRHCQWVVLG